MRAIVTLCDGCYQPLLPLWLTRLRILTELPVYIIALPGFSATVHDLCQIVRVDHTANPMPSGSWEYGLAEKLLVFEHLPTEVTEILFLDVDVLVLGDFWSTGHFEQCTHSLVICQDFFVGYKEHLEQQFAVFDPSFQMGFYPDGTYRYYNSGVFFASRALHAREFRNCLEVGRAFIQRVGSPPPLFDQSLLNYWIVKTELAVTVMPIENNCLRHYSPAIQEGKMVLGGKKVNAYHFNGGTPTIKHTRWLQVENLLRGA